MFKNHRSFFLFITFFFVNLLSFPASCQDFSQIADKVFRGVVIVIGKGPGTHSFGSGFFVTSGGKILTSYSVIEGMDSFSVKFKDNNMYPAELVACDKERVLALLKATLSMKAFSVLPLTATTPEVGTQILAVGAPDGREYNAFDGLVVGMRKLGQTIYLETTCPLSRGSMSSPF